MKIKSKAKARYWLNHIQAAQQQEISLAEYARQHQLSNKSIYRWKKVLTKTGQLTVNSPSSSFIKVTSAIPSGGESLVISADSATVRVMFNNGHCIELTASSTDVGQLLQKISTL